MEKLKEFLKSIMAMLEVSGQIITMIAEMIFIYQVLSNVMASPANQLLPGSDDTSQPQIAQTIESSIEKIDATSVILTAPSIEEEHAATISRHA